MKQLQGAPWLLAHRSMLKPNRPLKISLLGNDYVLWQDSLGNINALPNACPHMGAMLSEGWCVAQSDGSSAFAKRGVSRIALFGIIELFHNTN